MGVGGGGAGRVGRIRACGGGPGGGAGRDSSMTSDGGGRAGGAGRVSSMTTGAAGAELEDGPDDGAVVRVSTTNFFSLIPVGADGSEMTV